MRTLEVLIVDDEEELAELTRLKLLNEAPDLRITKFVSAESCLVYLRTRRADCIVSDYQMPGMCGMEFLDTLRASGNDVPFIFFTGHGSEDIAREAFKNGADDYFIKDYHLPRFPMLVNSIEQAVRQRETEAERSKAEECLLREKAKLEAVLACVGDFISIVDLDCRILYQNPAQKASSGELAGRFCYEAYGRPKEECSRCHIMEAMETGRAYRVTKVDKSHGFAQAEITASPMFDHEGNIIAGIEVVRDVSARVEAERVLAFERAQTLSIFEGMTGVIYVSDPHTNEVLFANKAMRDTLGHDPVGGKCHAEFQGLSEPCPFCTNGTILGNGGTPHRWTHRNLMDGKQYTVVDRLIKWPDGRDARFEFALEMPGEGASFNEKTP